MPSIVSSVLCPLIKLWLRSQVEAVEGLEVKIQGANRQILQGQVPQAEVCGQEIVYQGLSLSNINLVAVGNNTGKVGTAVLAKLVAIGIFKAALHAIDHWIYSVAATVNTP